MLLWNKWGNIFDPSKEKPHWWMQAYAQCPYPFVLDDEIMRVYFACRPQRDAKNMSVSYSAYVDLARRDPTKVIAIADQPIIPLGKPGTFDQFGVTTTTIVRTNADIRAYYTGWTRMVGVPYTMAIGVASSRDGGKTFEKLGEGPLLGTTLDEPYLHSGPVVRIFDENWHLWYLNGQEWISAEGKWEPVYQIAHAVSNDGLNWTRKRGEVLPVRAENECQVSLSMFQRDGIWHGVFAYREPTDFRSNSDRSYRLGYAWSHDLETWYRNDGQVGIDVSETGWDSEMMCYPQICEIDGRVLLFYCGNEFGRNGFGIAELTDCTHPDGTSNHE